MLQNDLSIQKYKLQKKYENAHVQAHNTLQCDTLWAFRPAILTTHTLSG